jgi:hypothetical protein
MRNLIFQMTTFSISCLLQNLTNGYSILHQIKVENGLVLGSYIFFCIVSIFTFMAILIITIYKSVECMSEIEETSNIVSKIFNLKLNLELEEMLRTFCKQIFLRNRKIKSGYFVIDWTLLQKVAYSRDCIVNIINILNCFQILGSTVAFLIITYQFGETTATSSINCTNFTLNQSKALY